MPSKHANSKIANILNQVAQVPISKNRWEFAGLTRTSFI
jgi:hypothetical protein